VQLVNDQLVAWTSGPNLADTTSRPTSTHRLKLMTDRAVCPGDAVSVSTDLQQPRATHL
jgi:hypothetical protein